MVPPTAHGQWIQTNAFADCFCSDGPLLYAGAGGIPTEGNVGGVIASTDNGETWHDVDSGTIGSEVFTMALHNSTIFAGAGSSPENYVANSPDTLWKSTDYGATWTMLKLKSGYTTLLSLAFNGMELFASTAEGLLRSDDSGRDWKVLSDSQYLPVVFYGPKIYAGSAFQGLIVSSDSGMSWKSVGMPYGRSVGDIKVVDSFLVALVGAPNWFDLQADTGIFLAYSTDGGKMWQERLLDPSLDINAFAFDGRNLYAASMTSVGSEWYSSDTGQTWEPISGGSGLPVGAGPAYALDLIASGTNIVVASGNRGVWYYPLDKLVVNPSQSTIGTTLSVFPNPTPGPITIRGATGAVTVTNVLGEEVLSTDGREPNSGNVELDLSKLPAGTYFVCIETAGRAVVRKILKE